MFDAFSCESTACLAHLAKLRAVLIDHDYYHPVSDTRNRRLGNCRVRLRDIHFGDAFDKLTVRVFYMIRVAMIRPLVQS